MVLFAPSRLPVNFLYSIVPMMTSRSGIQENASSDIPARPFRSPSVPERIIRSQLMGRGGYDVLTGVLDEHILTMLLGEAMETLADARETSVPFSDEEEVRGGNPARKFLNSAAGPLQEGFSHAPWMLDLLRELCGPTLRPTGSLGTYSYYVRPGDHLDIHRDIETCDVAVISCLYDTPGAGDGGMLGLYPNRIHEPLSAIRATPDTGIVKLRLAPAETLVMFGGIVPHVVMPVAQEQSRIVSVLCYQV